MYFEEFIQFSPSDFSSDSSLSNTSEIYKINFSEASICEDNLSQNSEKQFFLIDQAPSSLKIMVSDLNAKDEEEAKLLLFELGKLYGKVDAIKVFGQINNNMWVGAIKFNQKESVIRIKMDRNSLQMVKFYLKTCRIDDFN